jgi:TM2 domain-containing membrane protein YozV
LDNHTATKNVRRYNAYLSPTNTNLIHLRNPWVSAWWSAAFPGFGHIHLGQYIKGFILFFWEIIINVNAKINIAMIYSFTGQFDLAKDVINIRFVMMYIPVYLYCIWDSYRLTIDLNKHYHLAESEKAPIVLFKMTGFAFNSLDKRNPWVALVWSLLFPGLGSLYIHRMISGFFVISWTAVILYFSHLLEAIQYTFIGAFNQATAVLNPEWILFMPSIYCFAAYEAYILSIEFNKLYKKEQKQFLQKNYSFLNNPLLKTKRK